MGHFPFTRKWERDDERSYVLISDMIVSEFDLFAIEEK